MGMGKTVRKVTMSKNYLMDPVASALKVWTNNNCDLAANGALMRTSVLGIINYFNITQVIIQTLDIALATHIDPRCAASCIAQTSAIALMLQGVNEEIAIRTAKDISKALLPKYVSELQRYLSNKSNAQVMKKFREKLNEFDVESLNKYLDAEFEDLIPLDDKNMGYTYICLGCSFWAARQNNWIDAIQRIVLEGGDADTNAAVAGALLGCKIGYNNLPQNLIAELRHKDWYHEKVIKLLKTMERNHHYYLNYYNLIV